MAEIKPFSGGMAYIQQVPKDQLTPQDLLQLNAINHTIEQARIAFEAALGVLNEADAALCTAIVAKQAIDELIVRSYAFDVTHDELEPDGRIIRGVKSDDDAHVAQN